MAVKKSYLCNPRCSTVAVKTFFLASLALISAIAFSISATAATSGLITADELYLMEAKWYRSYNPSTQFQISPSVVIKDLYGTNDDPFGVAPRYYFTQFHPDLGGMIESVKSSMAETQTVFKIEHDRIYRVRTLVNTKSNDPGYDIDRVGMNLLYRGSGNSQVTQWQTNVFNSEKVTVESGTEITGDIQWTNGGLLESDGTVTMFPNGAYSNYIPTNAGQKWKIINYGPSHPTNPLNIGWWCRSDYTFVGNVVVRGEETIVTAPQYATYLLFSFDKARISNDFNNLRVIENPGDMSAYLFDFVFTSNDLVNKDICGVQFNYFYSGGNTWFGYDPSYYYDFYNYGIEFTSSNEWDRVVDAIGDAADRIIENQNTNTGKVISQIKDQTDRLIDSNKEQTDRLIENNDKNTDKLIENNNNNTDRIIKNQDDNTDRIINEDFGYERPDTEDIDEGLSDGKNLLGKMKESMDDFSANFQNDQAQLVGQIQAVGPFVSSSFNALPLPVQVGIPGVVIFLVFRKVTGR